MTQHLSLSTAVVLAPQRPGLLAGEDNVVDVLVRIQAPDAPAGHAAERAPQALALVLDRSGSMAGKPLLEARRCAEYVLRTLRPTDTVSIVAFDNRVKRLCPAAPLGDGTAQRTALATIHSGGNTDLHGGWKEGAETLVDVAGPGLKRVILLSDGRANQGLTDAAHREREKFGKEALYSSRKMSYRLAAKDELLDLDLSGSAEEIPAFLRRKAAQGKGDPQ